MQLVVPIGYGVWVWCDLTLSIIKLLTVRSWRSDANTVHFIKNYANVLKFHPLLQSLDFPERYVENCFAVS